MIPIFTGLIASTLHVVSGPDHLAAVTPFAIESRKKSWLVGMFWGFGHTIGILIVGLLMLLFRELIPVEQISGYSEQLVGIMLIVIGVWAIVKLVRHKDQQQHFVSAKRSSVASLSVGVFHGLAGVSHLIAILPTLALPTKTDAGMYLFGFAVGSIAVMILYAFALGFITLKFSENKRYNMVKAIRAGGGLLAIFVGILWISLTF